MKILVPKDTKGAEAKYRSRIFTKTQVLFVRRQRPGWRRWAWWWWPPARWCPAPSTPRATCRGDFEDQQSVGPSWKCGGSSLLGPTMEWKGIYRLFLLALLNFPYKNENNLLQTMAAESVPWFSPFNSVNLQVVFLFSAKNWEGCFTEISNWKKNMWYTDQSDHGAGLADDLHVVQPWGAMCDRDLNHHSMYQWGWSRC